MIKTNIVVKLLQLHLNGHRLSESTGREKAEILEEYVKLKRNIENRIDAVVGAVFQMKPSDNGSGE